MFCLCLSVCMSVCLSVHLSNCLSASSQSYYLFVASILVVIPQHLRFDLTDLHTYRIFVKAWLAWISRRWKNHVAATGGTIASRRSARVSDKCDDKILTEYGNVGAIYDSGDVSESNRSIQTSDGLTAPCKVVFDADHSIVTDSSGYIKPRRWWNSKSIVKRAAGWRGLRCGPGNWISETRVRWCYRINVTVTGNTACVVCCKAELCVQPNSGLRRRRRSINTSKVNISLGDISNSLLMQYQRPCCNAPACWWHVHPSIQLGSHGTWSARDLDVARIPRVDKEPHRCRPRAGTRRGPLWKCQEVVLAELVYHVWTEARWGQL